MTNLYASKIVDKIIGSLPDHSFEYQQVRPDYWHLIYHPTESSISGMPAGSPWYVAALRFKDGTVVLERMGQKSFACPVDDLDKLVAELDSIIRNNETFETN